MTEAGLDPTALTDSEIVNHVRNGQIEVYEVLMRRHNQSLFRVARSILRDDIEAEDVIQDAYVKAFEHLDQFSGASKFSTWLTKIAIHEALSRLRRRRRFEGLADSDEIGAHSHHSPELRSKEPGPEEKAMTEETARVLENAVDRLPEAYRCVFVMSAMNGMNIGETAACLNITEENVKTRLHRARAMLKRSLAQRFGDAAFTAFQFRGYRCDRVVNAVMYRVTKQSAQQRGLSS